LTVFPNGRYDDQVDSTSQAFAWTKQRPPGWGILEFYRREAEKVAHHTEPEMVRLKAPPGISHVETITGQRHCVEGGCVSIPKDDVPPLIGTGFVRA